MKTFEAVIGGDKWTIKGADNNWILHGVGCDGYSATKPTRLLQAIWNYYTEQGITLEYIDENKFKEVEV